MALIALPDDIGYKRSRPKQGSPWVGRNLRLPCWDPRIDRAVTAHPAALEWATAQLDTDRRRHPQFRTRPHRPGNGLAIPAFRFDRRSLLSPPWHPQPQSKAPIPARPRDPWQVSDNRRIVTKFRQQLPYSPDSPDGGCISGSRRFRVT
jgi:hypothetical protein